MSTIPDHTFDPPLAPRGPRTPSTTAGGGLDPSAFPDLSVTPAPAPADATSAITAREGHTTPEALTQAADALHELASSSDEKDLLDEVIDGLVGISPLPDTLDRWILRRILKALPGVLANLRDRIGAVAG